jgi:hypothetical protein
MKPAFPPCADHGDWKSLYRAAILETNRNVIPQKVSEAELAVLARGRELFYTGGTSEEKESLEDALYALRAFRSALKHTEGEISDTAAEAAAA